MPDYHSAELERHLLGLLIMYPAKLKELPINSELFYKETNRRVFSAIEKMIGEKDALETVDMVLLSEEVRRMDKGIDISGVTSLTDGVTKTSVKNLPDIVERLSALAQKREMWKAVKRLEKALDTSDDEEARRQAEKISTIQIDAPKREKSLADEVRDWISVVSGEFPILDVYKDLGNLRII